MTVKKQTGPAFVPEPDPPVEQSYTVTGTQAVLGHEPGDTFSTTLAPDQERFYLNGGHLTKKEDKS